MTDVSVILIPLAVALVLFAALWPLSVWKRDASLVDFLWAPGFAVQIGLAAWLAGSVGDRGLVILGLVGVWCARLSVVMIGRRLREGHEDPRYTTLRDSWGEGFWWKSFFIVFVLQAVIQWIISVGPIMGLLAVSEPVGPLALAGIMIALAGIVIETIADRQLDQFKRSARPGALLTTGLRAHVRYPNYSGEILFWLGLGLVCVEAGSPMGLVSAVLIAGLLAKVSGAPMLEERLEATRPEFDAYRERVPAFVPTLSRRTAAQ